MREFNELGGCTIGIGEVMFSDFRVETHTLQRIMGHALSSLQSACVARCALSCRSAVPSEGCTDFPYATVVRKSAESTSCSICPAVTIHMSRRTQIQYLSYGRYASQSLVTGKVRQLERYDGDHILSQ